MNIFLTGGSGFVGRTLITKLIAEGHQVKALARTESSAEKIKELGAEVVRGSLSEIDSLLKSISGTGYGFYELVKKKFSVSWTSRSFRMKLS